MHKRTRTINLKQLKSLAIGGAYIFSGKAVKAREFLRTKAAKEIPGKFSVHQVGPLSTIERVE